jgi:hypothetical protein
MGQATKYNILYLEDDYTDSTSEKKDDRIKKLVNAMHEKNIYCKLITEPNKRKSVLAQGIGSKGKFDAIICDIEIWKDAEDGVRELVYLGFNYINWLQGEAYDFVYIILSNVTRDFIYREILIDVDRKRTIHPFLKDDVIQNDASRQKFIYDIKKLIDDKTSKKSSSSRKGRVKMDSNPLKYFRQYIEYLRKDSNYGDNGITITVGAKTNICKNYSDVKGLIESETEALKTNINLNTLTFSHNPPGENEQTHQRFVYFIKDNIGSVGEKRPQYLVSFTLLQTQAFIRTLIARRLLIYIILEAKSINFSKIFTNTQKQYPQTNLCFPSNISRKIIENNDKELFSKEECKVIRTYFTDKKQ